MHAACMCKYIHICLHIIIYIYIYTHIRTCTSIRIYAYTKKIHIVHSICVYARIYIYIERERNVYRYRTYGRQIDR